MLEQLTQLVRQFGQDQVVDNAEIPNEYNNGVMAEAASSIFSGLQNTVAQGGLPSLMGMFRGDQSQSSIASNPITSAITGSFVNNIMNKFGIKGSTAQMIAAALIPMVLSKLVNRAKDPSDNGINEGSILDSLTGGALGGGASMQQNQPQQSGFGGMLSKIGGALGMDRDGDGDVDLNDLTARTSTAAQQAQQRQGGSILDTIGGLLGGLR